LPARCGFTRSPSVISYLSHITFSLRVLPRALLYVAWRRSHLLMRSCLFPHRKNPHLEDLAHYFMRLRSYSFSMMPAILSWHRTLFPTGDLLGSERMFVCPTPCKSAFRSPARQNIKPCLQQSQCGAMSIGAHQHHCQLETRQICAPCMDTHSTGRLVLIHMEISKSDLTKM
jgi:hypothetical protein